MKKHLLLVVAIFAAVTLAAQVNPRGKATMDDDKIVIEYGRPSAKGRDVLSMAQPGSYWRFGADQATTMTTTVDLLFGDSRVVAGEYTLLGHFVSEDAFDLVVAKSVSRGRPSEEAGRSRAEITKGQEHVEQMTIEIDGAADGGDIVLSWGSNRIRMPFRVAP